MKIKNRKKNARLKLMGATEVCPKCQSKKNIWTTDCGAHKFD